MLYSPSTYTVESVTSGHPDKVCDQISDACLDACLAQDPNTRAAIETFGSHGLLVIGGELTSRAEVDFESIAREVYHQIGYDESLEVITKVVQQSPDISQGVDIGGAGDQGIMYGYACGDNQFFLPQSLVAVHALAQGLENLRKNDPKFSWLRPDGKTQITVKDHETVAVLVSTQHDPLLNQAEIRERLIQGLIVPVLGNMDSVQVLVNPTGKFVQGGFSADAGLTGRKIMVDTYGGLITHGGGCFSGKDATKVDRSAAYMARFAAKNLVANRVCDQCLVTVAYAIGRAEPLMLEAFDENGKSLGYLVREKFDFRPQAIIERLDLRRPIYKPTATYGHFGKENLPWEEVVEL